MEAVHALIKFKFSGVLLAEQVQGFFNQSACISLSSLKDKMGKSFFVTVYTATIGGYCRVPNECICRSGYSGATCQTGMWCTLEIFHM